MKGASILVAVAFTLAVVGCGNKGPLHLPGAKPGAAWPAPPPTPSPKAPTERRPAEVPATSETNR
jgi:predicted small lipoprotein YifL